MAQGEEVSNGNDDRLLLLYEEQARLRGEIDRLRHEQEGLKNDHGSNGDQGNDKQEHGEDKGDKEHKGDEGGKDDKEDEQKKPPLTQRVGAWTRAHPLATVLGIVGFVVLLVAAFFVWRYLETYENTDDAEVDGHTDPISSRVMGRVVGVYVENTQEVARGQTVVDLDPRDYRVALAQARANLAETEAALHAEAPSVPITQTSELTNVETSNLNVTSAEAALQSSRKNYDAALADLDQAQANEANAAAEELRYRQLVEKQEVSREIYDQRATTLRAQQGAVAARRAAAEAARKSVDVQQAAVAQAQERAKEAQANSPRRVLAQHATVASRGADVQVANARVQQALLNLSYCKIAAPVAGIVGNKTVEVGMDVSPGQELFAITQINDIWVTANFKETQIRRMHQGQSVSIQVDALSQTFNGFVEQLAGATGAVYSLLPPENATGNYVKVVQRLPVRIRFKPNQKGLERLRLGMSVEPKVWVE